MRNSRRRDDEEFQERLIGFISTVILVSPAAAENVLRFTIGIGGAVTMDPHSRWTVGTERPALQQVYETLLDIDSNLAIVPQLALNWKPLDPTTWELELRPAVTFHDGTPFTAADVLFSIERARADTSLVQTFVSNIAAVSAVDDHTVQIKTTAPDPLLWMRLSNVAIMSEGWARANDVRTPTNVDAGEETFASRHANGTGPFRLEEFEPRGRWVMVRNPNWWAPRNTPTTSTASFIITRVMRKIWPPCSMAKSICSLLPCTRGSMRSSATPI
jgi:peptide/nickel transport system substrate-binding protein